MLDNKQLSNQTKLDYISQLLKRGYWYEQLAKPSLLIKLLHPDFKDLLIPIYFTYHDIIPDEITFKIWDILLKDQHIGIDFFNNLITYNTYRSEDILLYVIYWMNSINNKLDVMNAKNEMLKTIENTHYLMPLKKYKKEIIEIVELRILAMTKDEKKTGDEKEIEKFLHSTEPAFGFNLFKKHYSAFDIYKKILAGEPDVENLYNHKYERMLQNLHGKLST